MRLKTFITLFALFILIGVCIGSVSAQVGGDEAYYSISSVPMGASVTVDGRNEGTTPVIATISASGTPGHTIEVSLAGYDTWTQYVPGNPEPGTTTTFNAVLQPGPVTPTVTITIPTVTTPVGGDQGYFRYPVVTSGGEVTFDDSTGETPVTVPVYTSATPRHTISISHPGTRPGPRHTTRTPARADHLRAGEPQPAQTSGAIYVTSALRERVAPLTEGIPRPRPAPFQGFGRKPLDIHLLLRGPELGRTGDGVVGPDGHGQRVPYTQHHNREPAGKQLPLGC